MTREFSDSCCSTKKPTPVLLVTDQERTRKAVCASVSASCELKCCSGADGAADLIENGGFECVLVDMQLPGDDTLALVRGIRRGDGNPPIMLMCSAAEISSAVEGIRAGASDFVIKEVEMANLPERIAKVTGRAAKTLKGLPGQATKAPGAANQMVVGRSRRMLEVMEIARRAASFPVTMLLLGESGVGKGLFANWIHRMSHCSDGPFVAVNLAAIPSDLVESTLFGHEKGAFTGAVGPRTGKFALAQNGTLLLDEITELKLELQPKLLRVLQEGEFERVGGERVLRNETRVIAATNQDIFSLVQRGEFRNDLFYRLNIVTITLPPLRERKEDIPDLAALFLAKYNAVYERNVRGVSPEAMEALIGHSWPGNIRELEHAVQRAVIVSDGETVCIRDLFDTEQPGRNRLVDQGAERQGTLEDLERQYIEEILRRTQGHQGQAAKILGIDRKTLYNKIMKYGLRRSLDPDSQEDDEEGKIPQGWEKIPKSAM